MVMSSWGDGGMSLLIKSGKQEGHFSKELVDAFVEMITIHWKPEPKPTWITCVPSLRRTQLVKKFAQSVAESMNLPFVSCISKVRETQPQKLMNNSFQQIRNLEEAFIIDNNHLIKNEPVFLIDDMVDSRWTFTILAALLQSAGSGPVYPCALTDTQGKDTQ